MIHVDDKETKIKGARIDIYSDLASLSHGLKVIGYSDGEIINSIKLGLVDKKDAEELAEKVLEAAFDKYVDKILGGAEE